MVWSYERSAYGCMVTQIGSIEVNNDVVDVINNDQCHTSLHKDYLITELDGRDRSLTSSGLRIIERHELSCFLSMLKQCQL